MIRLGVAVGDLDGMDLMMLVVLGGRSRIQFLISAHFLHLLILRGV